MNESNFSRRMALAALAGSALVAKATDSNSWTTAHRFNGHAWAGLDEEQRALFVSGCADGANYIVATTFPALSAADQNTLSTIQNTAFSSAKFTSRDVLNEITKLYNDEPAYAIIPIVDVLAAATMLLNGSPKATVMQDLDRRRLQWLKQ